MLLLHITSTYFGGIPPLHNPIYMQMNQNEKSVKLSVVEVPSEVVVVHKFEMEMVPLLVGLSLEQLQLYQKQQ